MLIPHDQISGLRGPAIEQLIIEQLNLGPGESVLQMTRRIDGDDFGPTCIVVHVLRGMGTQQIYVEPEIFTFTQKAEGIEMERSTDWRKIYPDLANLYPKRGE